MTTERPNIILMTSHDMGRHIAPYGINTVATPNCDRLARESVLLENCFCVAPQCSPARSSIVTGRYPHSNGVMGLTQGDYAWSMHDDERPLAHLVKDAGYRSWLLGLQHETPNPETLGFDHVELGFSLLEAPQRLAALLDTHDAQAAPFYCQLGCFEAHRPFDWQGTEPAPENGVTIPGYYPDEVRANPDVHDEFAAFEGMIQRYDRGLGGVLDLLDQRGLADNTLLIVTTDHGIPFPMAKGTLLDPGIEVMAFVRWPQRWRGGQRRSELVSHVDFLPTILQSIGAETPDNVHGHSLLPLLDHGSAVRDAVFVEKNIS